LGLGAVVVSEGARHNIIKTGNEPQKLPRIYPPPKHRDGV
jgi:hypothetical protein